jgi:hypothetical protein
MPLGIYVGTGPAAINDVIKLCIGGIAYTCPDSTEAATVLRTSVGHQSNTNDGYVEYDTSATDGEHGSEIGHPLYAEAAFTFNASTGVNTGTDTITLASAPGWAVGDPCVYWAAGDTPPTGMVTGYVYWVKTISSAAVTLSRTQGGATLDITATGTGTANYLQRLPKTAVHFN